jgi:hypothetical protein
VKRYFVVMAVFLMNFPALAATSIPFTINMSEAVTVSGCPATCPRIAIDVGGTTRYATYTSGSGTASLIFTYQMVSGDVDLDGIALSSPIDLNGGTIKDAVGNDATLTFVPPDTSGINIAAAVPSGYTAVFDADTVTNINKTAMGFTLTYGQAGHTYNYTISSSGGGAPLTGSGSTTGAAQVISGINLTSLPDGKLTLSVTVTDSLGGVGAAATDTAPMAVLDASLVGHWTFDATDISGTTVYDRSGNGHNGTMQGTPTVNAGKIGNGLEFGGHGSGDRVSLGSSASLNPGAFTLVSWVSPGIVSGSYGYIYSNSRDCCGSYNGIDFVIHSNKLRGRIWNSTAIVKASVGSIGDNSGWHQATYSYDGATIKLYINGVFDSQVSTGLGVGSPASYDSYIGTMGHGAGTYTIDGILDDVRIYNRALTPTEITTLYSHFE